MACAPLILTARVPLYMAVGDDMAYPFLSTIHGGALGGKRRGALLLG